MSVVKSKRSKPKLKPILDANALIRHTLVITGNEKIFKPCYKALTDDIIRKSETIFTKCWEANNIRVTDIQNAKWRFNLQTQAIHECQNMLALINIAYGVFHLRGRRVEYWTNLILTTSDSISKWRKSDKERYGW